MNKCIGLCLVTSRYVAPPCHKAALEHTVSREAEDVEGLVAEDGHQLAAVGPLDFPHRDVDAPDGLRSICAG